MRSRFTSRDRLVTNSPELSLNAFSNRRPRTSLGQSLCYNARYPTWSVESPGFSETIRQKIVQDTVYTIGHSNHDWDSFSALLKTHGIEILVDTRSNPASRFASFSNHRTLPGLLEHLDIEYVFLGGPLGGKPSDESFYDANGKPDYRKMRATDEFDGAVEQVASMPRRANIAQTCSEEDPSACHRLLLLGPSLEEARGLRLLHIRKSGEVLPTNRLDRSRKHQRQIQGSLLNT